MATKKTKRRKKPAARPHYVVRQTHTYVVLELSGPAYREVAAKLKEAGYDHAFHEDDGRIVIDMHGLAVAGPDLRSCSCSDDGVMCTTDPNCPVHGHLVKRRDDQYPESKGTHSTYSSYARAGMHVY